MWGMQGLVAVERNLANIAEVLEESGYEVVPLDEANLQIVDAVVVSGMDNNLLNNQETITEVSVINAAGKSPADVLEELARL